MKLKDVKPGELFRHKTWEPGTVAAKMEPHTGRRGQRLTYRDIESGIRSGYVDDDDDVLLVVFY